MTLFGIDHRTQLGLCFVIIVVAFAFVARIDYVFIPREAMAEYTVDVFGLIQIHEGWAWMSVGWVLLAVGTSLFYIFAATDTERNMWYAFGLFASVIVLAVFQLEDFFYHALNPEVSWVPASQDWTHAGWSATNNIWWKLAGTWNTDLHLIVVGVGVAIVVAMWILIFEYT